MSKLETNTIDTVSGTSTLQVGSTNTTTITLGASGDTINIPSGATIANSGTATGFGGVNTPAFRANASGTTSISNASWTKINIANEIFDVGTNYDTSNSRFTPTTSGKYVFTIKVMINNAGTFNIFRVGLYKNGSEVDALRKSYYYSAGDSATQNQMLVSIQEANGSGDYFEVYAYQDAGGAVNAQSGSGTSFSGYKLIE